MESFSFIVDTAGSADSPRPSTPSNSSWRQRGKSFCLVAMLVLVAGGISAGLSVYMRQCNAPKQISPCHEKKNKTVSITKEDHDFKHQYKICKIHRTGTYFIYGHVEKKTVRPEKDSVILFVKLRKNSDIDEQSFSDSVRKLTFAKEVDLEENAVLYLRFNFDEPDLDKTTFTIYEL